MHTERSIVRQICRIARLFPIDEPKKKAALCEAAKRSINRFANTNELRPHVIIIIIRVPFISKDSPSSSFAERLLRQLILSCRARWNSLITHVARNRQMRSESLVHKKGCNANETLRLTSRNLGLSVSQQSPQTNACLCPSKSNNHQQNVRCSRYIHYSCQDASELRVWDAGPAIVTQKSDPQRRARQNSFPLCVCVCVCAYVSPQDLSRALIYI